MLRKVKKTQGEILLCQQINEKKPTVIKNFGIWLRYDSRSGTHNMYREYRDLTTSGAVTQCYRDMGARHRARPSSIQIMKVAVIPASEVKSKNLRQYLDSKIKFPLPHRVERRLHYPRFTTRRPHTKFWTSRGRWCTELCSLWAYRAWLVYFGTSINCWALFQYLWRALVIKHVLPVEPIVNLKFQSVCVVISGEHFSLINICWKYVLLFWHINLCPSYKKRTCFASRSLVKALFVSVDKMCNFE